MHLEISLKPKNFVSLQVYGASLKKSLAGLDSTQTDGVQALATLEDITHQLKQAGEIQTPSIITVGARVVTTFNKLTEYQYLLLCVFFLSQDWIAQWPITF